MCVRARACMYACLLAYMCVQLVQVGGAHEPAIALGLGGVREGLAHQTLISTHTYTHT